MTRILIPRAGTCSAKVVSSTDWPLYFNDLINDYVISGLCVSAGTGLAVNIASGSARVCGLHLCNTICCMCAVTGLTACSTCNFIYAQVNLNVCCQPKNFTFVTNITGVIPTRGIKLAKATTNATCVTSVDNTTRNTLSGVEQAKDCAQVYAHSTTIGDYAQPTSATATSEGTDSEYVASSTGTVFESAWNRITPTCLCKIIDDDWGTESVYGESTGGGNIGVDFGSDTTITKSRVKFTYETGAAGGVTTAFLEVEPAAGGFVIVKTYPAVGPIDKLINETVTFASQAVKRIRIRVTSTGGDPRGKLKIHEIVKGDIFLATDAVDCCTTSNWRSASVVAPAIFVDMNAAADMVGVAINPEAATTTTEIKIRASTDSTFTDSENVRTITMSDLTNGSCNFIRFNRLIQDKQFLQIIGTDSTAKILSINEIKVLKPTDVNRRHGHLLIPTEEISLNLDGTQ